MILNNGSKKVGIYVAHDDDAILAVGGRIVQHLKKGDDVYIIICTDGRHSHRHVLRIKTNPTPLEVKNKRRIETEKAMGDLGVQKEMLYFLNLTEGDGKVRQNEESTKKQIKEITESEKPDLIYFHYPDAQPDHQILAKITLEVLRETIFSLNAYQFFVWTKELAKGRPEVDDSRIVDVPLTALRVDISAELVAKRNAIFRMKSQVNVWPYSNWQIQKAPILDKKFLDYFLGGEEIFLKVKN